MTSNAPEPADVATEAPRPPLVVLEMVGDLDVGACVDGVCEVPPAGAAPADQEPAADAEELTQQP